MRRLAVPLVLGMLVMAQGCGTAPEPDTAATLLEQARSAWLSGEYARAETSYQRYLQEVPKGIGRLEAWRRLADIALTVWGNPASALPLFEAAMLECGPDAPVFFLLGQQAVETALVVNNPGKALALMDQLAVRKALPPERLVWIAIHREQAFLERQDRLSAMRTLRQCRQSGLPNAQTAVCTLHLASILHDLDRSAEAEPLWRTIYKDGTVAKPQRAQAGFALAEAAESRKDTKAARALYEAIKNWYPNPMAVMKKLEYLNR